MSPVFVVGCDRSGTTLLRLMLDQSPGLHIPAESGFLPDLDARAGEYGDFSTERGRWFFIRDLQHYPATSKTRAFDIFDLSVEEAERALAAVAPTSYPRAAAALFEACARKKGKPRWGDKTPRYVLSIDWLAGAFPDARFVHIIRDPRDVTMSIRRAGWGNSFRGAANFWLERVSAGRRAGEALGEAAYREIRYEDLVRDPEAQLRALCEWLDVPYVSEMLQFHERSEEAIPRQHRDLFPLASRPVDPARAQAWRSSMSRRALADVEQVAGGLMDELGYERTGTKQRLWIRGMRLVAGRARPLSVRVLELMREAM